MLRRVMISDDPVSMAWIVVTRHRMRIAASNSVFPADCNSNLEECFMKGRGTPIPRVVIAAALLVLLSGCQRAPEPPTADSAKAVVDTTPGKYSREELAQRTVRRRATEAIIWGIPAVNYDLMRQAMLTRTAGKVGQIIYWGKPLDWHNQTLTPNPDTLYFMGFFSLAEGPMVAEIPPADTGALNFNIVTVWQQPLEDAGALGVDKGAGVKLLLVPPGYDKPIPKGYNVLRPDTLGVYFLYRSNLKSHDDADVAASVAYGKRVKVYPLSQASTPPETVFTDVQGIDFDSTIRYDASFFDNLNRIVQEEPWLGRDRAFIDTLKSLGIEKGKPFNPDAATKKTFDEAALEARAWLDDKYDAGWAVMFEGTHWRAAAPASLVKAAQSEFADPNEYPIDTRGLTYSFAYIGLKRLGVGQFYLIAIADKNGNSMDGAKNYRLHVPPNVPVEQYWSVTVYDRETHALVKNMAHASRASNNTSLQKNDDGSVDLYFGPSAPAGKESNWVPTDPKREFELMFRLYGPKKELFDKIWTLPDAELQARS